MFSEVVKLVPSLDRAALGQMFQSLNQRFSAVAKKFGDGMKNALKFGGVIALVSGLVSKLLNPLEKAEEIINRILSKGDDAMTNAEEFGSDPGKLLRLEALAQTKGLDSATLRQLLGKFQGALAKEQDAAAAPERIEQQITTTAEKRHRLDLQSELLAPELEAETDPKRREALVLQQRSIAQQQALLPDSSILEKQLLAAQKTADEGGVLHEFIGEKDLADAFFNFIQAVQKLDKPQQTVIQSQVFGERVRGKAAEFFNATDFAEILKQLPSADVLADAAKKSGAVADKNDQLKAIREIEDFVTKSGLVDESQIQAIDQSERLKEQGENETLKRFDSLKTSSIAIQELTHKFDAFTTDFITNVAPQLVNGVNIISHVASEFLPSFQEVKTALDDGFTKLIEGIGLTTMAIQEVWESGGEILDSMTSKISSLVSSVEATWGEFKSSRFYRTFGGGK